MHAARRPARGSAYSIRAGTWMASAGFVVVRSSLSLEFHAGIQEYAAADAITAGEHVFLVPRMQQIETGERNAQPVVRLPAQPHIEFSVGGHVRIRQFA